MLQLISPRTITHTFTFLIPIPSEDPVHSRFNQIEFIDEPGLKVPEHPPTARLHPLDWAEDQVLCITIRSEELLYHSFFLSIVLNVRSVLPKLVPRLPAAASQVHPVWSLGGRGTLESYS